MQRTTLLKGNEKMDHDYNLIGGPSGKAERTETVTEFSVRAAQEVVRRIEDRLRQLNAQSEAIDIERRELERIAQTPLIQFGGTQPIAPPQNQYGGGMLGGGVR